MENQKTTKETLLKVDNLHTYYPIKKGLFSRTVGYVKAVNGVSIELFEGETLGLVGESGCGKTTLGRTIVGLENTFAGDVYFKGNKINNIPNKQMRKYRRNLQMIFQDPMASLNPRMTAMNIVTEGLMEYKLVTAAERQEKAESLLAEVGLDPEVVHRYPHEFSGGQRQRLSIARSMAVNPECVICDESVSALDVSVQAQVLNLLQDLKDKHKLSYLFISHDLSVVKWISDRIAVMYLGNILEIGDSELIMENPLHPYTQALVAAIPVPGKIKKEKIVTTGEIPSPANPPSGCPFHPRCHQAMPVCSKEVPQAQQVDGRCVSCHLYNK